jgi:DNA-binding transcriptional regulator YiaG
MLLCIYYAAMEEIREIRRQLGLTQIEFADLLGIHQSTLSRHETGDVPPDKRTLLAVQALLANRAGKSDQAAAA